jgi:hypothetical protein
MSERLVLRGARYPGDIAIADGRIVAIGSVAAEPGDTVVDVSGDIVTAGLINTHHHLYQWITRGRAVGCNLFDWLTTLYPVWGRLDADDVRAAAPSIHHHTEPMVTYLGTNPSYFTRVYRFAELGTLAKDICTLTKITAQMPRRQTGGPKFTASDLSSDQIERLRAFYAADYTFLERLDALEARPTPRHPPAGDKP